MYYHYAQNNTGGNFHYSAKHGITLDVIIEATNTEEADKKATKLGLYFDGVNNDKDCSCCGDRWTKATEPHSLITDLSQVNKLRLFFNSSFYQEIDIPIFVHPKNGPFYGMAPKPAFHPERKTTYKFEIKHY